MARLPPGGDPKVAPKKPNLNQIRELVEYLEKPEQEIYKEMLKPEIEMARKLLDEARIKELIATLPFDPEIMRVLRKFKVPKRIVHDVLCAFFLLLSESEDHTRVCLLLPYDKFENFSEVKDFIIMLLSISKASCI